ncbi:adenylate cyclase [Leptolyngbya sp. NIES-3755]|nr:adenylate cyclase [Leptolyngbya sp. NIES-3755]
MPTPQSSTRRLTSLYIASLGTVAFLALLGQAIVQSMLSQQTRDSKVIEIATHQKILSWQLREAALALKVERDRENALKIREIQDILTAWDAADRKVQTAIQKAMIFNHDRSEIKRQADALAPSHLRIQTAARSIIASESRRSNPQQTLNDLREIREAGKEFADGINQLILTYNHQAQAGIAQLRMVEFGLFGLLLLILLLEGILVFRPAVDKLQVALNELAIALSTTQETAAQLAAEQAQSERLLLNILPSPIAERLKCTDETTQPHIADGFGDVTVLFADIVGFTDISARTSPQELVSLLNQIFSRFDRLAEHHGLEKIKTIGDAYMVVGGLPHPSDDHAIAVANMAIDMQDAINQFNRDTGEAFSIRIGMNTGAVVAGVIGIKKFIYDLWGDTVNIASRMESHGVAGGIQVTEATYKRLTDTHLFEPRGIIQVKGRGEMATYWLKGKKQLVPTV